MNGIPQPFTEEFIAACLLGFDSIDTFLQTFRYLFPDAVEDLVQEVFISVWEGKRTFSDIKELTNYLPPHRGLAISWKHKQIKQYKKDRKSTRLNSSH